MAHAKGKARLARLRMGDLGKDLGKDPKLSRRNTCPGKSGKWGAQHGDDMAEVKLLWAVFGGRGLEEQQMARNASLLQLSE